MAAKGGHIGFMFLAPPYPAAGSDAACAFKSESTALGMITLLISSQEMKETTTSNPCGETRRCLTLTVADKDVVLVAVKEQ